MCSREMINFFFTNWSIFGFPLYRYFYNGFQRIADKPKNKKQNYYLYESLLFVLPYKKTFYWTLDFHIQEKKDVHVWKKRSLILFGNRNEKPFVSPHFRFQKISKISTDFYICMRMFFYLVLRMCVSFYHIFILLYHVSSCIGNRNGTCKHSRCSSL